MAMCFFPFPSAHIVFDAEVPIENTRRATGVEIHDVRQTYQQTGKGEIGALTVCKTAKTILLAALNQRFSQPGTRAVHG